METCDWEPFMKAAMERNPVSLELAKDMSIEQAYGWLKEMPNDSIYDGKRLAQPDEVANYRAGDGAEKAFVMANIICNRQPQCVAELELNGPNVTLTAEGAEFTFRSVKGLVERLKLHPGKV